MSTKKLRLTFVLSSLRLSGGVKLIIEYSNRLAERGHKVSLVIPHKSADNFLREQLSSSVRLLESGASLPNKPRSYVVLLWLIYSLARAVPSSDVIVATHTPTVLPVLIASMVQRSRRLWLYMDYPEMFRARPFERWLLRNAPTWFHGIATISRPLTQVIKQITQKPIIEHVGAGLPRGEYLLAQTHQPLNVKPRILCLTDSRPRKGFIDFLRAAEKVHIRQPEVQFAIVSKHPLSLPNLFPCEVYIAPSDEKLVQLYCESDVFVFPSWQEGLGYPPLEAMACGIPTIIADSGGVRDYARDGYNCLVVPPRQPESLAEAILRLLSEPQLAQQVAKNGRKTARRYSWNDAIERLETLLTTVSAVR